MGKIKTIKEDMVFKSSIFPETYSYVIYQKMEPDGVQLMRIDEVSVKSLKQTKSSMLFLPQGFYRIIGSNSAINLPLPKSSLDAFEGLESSVLMRSFTAERNEENAITNCIINGMDCWMITKYLTPPNTNNIPVATTSYSIDKNSYLVMARGSSNGFFDCSTTISNIQTNIDIPDQIFKLP